MAQIINQNNVQMEVAWAGVPQINIGVQFTTVDVLDIPQGVGVTIATGFGTNIVNVGSAGKQLALISGTLSVNGSLLGSCTVNLDDQADTGNSNWTIGAGSITAPDVFPGAIDFQLVNSVVVLGGMQVMFSSSTIPRERPP